MRVAPQDVDSAHDAEFSFDVPARDGWHDAVIRSAKEGVSKAGNPKLEVYLGLLGYPEQPYPLVGAHVPARGFRLEQLLLAADPAAHAALKAGREVDVDPGSWAGRRVRVEIAHELGPDPALPPRASVRSWKRAPAAAAPAPAGDEL